MIKLILLFLIAAGALIAEPKLWLEHTVYRDSTFECGSDGLSCADKRAIGETVWGGAFSLLMIKETK